LYCWPSGRPMTRGQYAGDKKSGRWISFDGEGLVLGYWDYEDPFLERDD